MRSDRKDWARQDCLYHVWVPVMLDPGGPLVPKCLACRSLATHRYEISEAPAWLKLRAAKLDPPKLFYNGEELPGASLEKALPVPRDPILSSMDKFVRMAIATHLERQAASA